MYLRKGEELLEREAIKQMAFQFCLAAPMRVYKMMNLFLKFALRHVSIFQMYSSKCASFAHVFSDSTARTVATFD